MTKYYTFTGVDTSGDAVIYVKHGGDTVSREQMEGIATALGDRLNGLDPLRVTYQLRWNSRY